MSDNIETARKLLADFRWDMCRIVQGIDDLRSWCDDAEDDLARAREERRAAAEEEKRLDALAPGLWIISQDPYSRRRRYICTQAETQDMRPDYVRLMLAMEQHHDDCCKAVLDLWEQKGRGASANDVVNAVFRTLVTP